MKICKIQDVIPQSKIVVFAPHFDDAVFMLGGYIDELKKCGLLSSKKFHIIVLFSRSNYIARSGEGNLDTGIERLKLTTGKRLLEDMECLDELLGQFGYRYELAGEKECFVRGKAFAKSEMEFPHGMYEDFDEYDKQIFERMKRLVRGWADKEDTALIFPLAIKEHIDHFIIREAAIAVARERKNAEGAAFYFQEDKPYGGIANPEELERIEAFICDNSLTCRVFDYEPERLIDLTFRHYLSQVEEVYKVGIRNRAARLQYLAGSERPCDRICFYGEAKQGWH